MTAEDAEDRAVAWVLGLGAALSVGLVAAAAWAGGRPGGRGDARLDALREENDDSLSAYYHGSYGRLPVGATLRARPALHYLQDEGERALEVARPPQAPPRWDAWYMTQDPCMVRRMGGGPHIYRVEPTGPVTPVNYDWAVKLFDAIRGSGDQSARSQYADNYWANAASPVVYEDHDDGAKALPEVMRASYEAELRMNRWLARPQLEWLTPEVRVVAEAKCEDAEALQYLKTLGL